MPNFGEWVTWEGRKRSFDVLARELIGEREDREREPSEQDYEKAKSLFEELSNPQSHLDVFETEMASPFHRYFLENRIPDAQVSEYMREVFSGLDPNIIRVAQRQKASKLLSHLANYCETKMREISPDGQI